MSAPNTTPGTGVATTRPELPREIAQQITERRALNEMSRQIANLSWGKGMSAVALQSIAEFCRRYRVDPTNEVDILGGKIYRNANYFIRRGAELMRKGVVDSIQVLHVNADERLVKLAARNVSGAQEEMDARELMRIKHNIPENAKGAAVVRIRVAATGVILEGANYAGVDKDPVGTANPGKTAESRAYRRAWRLLVDTLPDLKQEEQGIESTEGAVARIITKEQERTAEVEKTLPLNKQIAPQAWMDGYDNLTTPEALPAVPLEETDDDLLAFDRALSEREEP